MNIVYGFGGLRSDGKILSINPVIPQIWKSYKFKFNYRGSLITVKVDHKQIIIENSGNPVEMIICKNKMILKDRICISK
jgi:maltose phosphorylase